MDCVTVTGSVSYLHSHWAYLFDDVHPLVILQCTICTHLTLTVPNHLDITLCVDGNVLSKALTWKSNMNRLPVQELLPQDFLKSAGSDAVNHLLLMREETMLQRPYRVLQILSQCCPLSIAAWR